MQFDPLFFEKALDPLSLSLSSRITTEVITANRNWVSYNILVIDMVYQTSSAYEQTNTALPFRLWAGDTVSVRITEEHTLVIGIDGLYGVARSFFSGYMIAKVWTLHLSCEIYSLQQSNTNSELYPKLHLNWSSLVKARKISTWTSRSGLVTSCEKSQ